MKYNVIENFLSKGDHINLKRSLTTRNFPWGYIDAIGDADDNERFHFQHMFYWADATENGGKTDYYYLIEPLLQKLNYQKLVRVKGNLMVKEPENYLCSKHTDFHKPHTVCLYYVNSNNGYTLLDDKIKVPSIENTAVIFDGMIPHQAASQTDTKIRLNININYLENYVDG